MLNINTCNTDINERWFTIHFFQASRYNINFLSPNKNRCFNYSTDSLNIYMLVFIHDWIDSHYLKCLFHNFIHTHRRQIYKNIPIMLCYVLGVVRFGIVTYIIVGFVAAVDELPLLDEMGINLLVVPLPSSFLSPDTLRTTLMLGVGTFVKRGEGW